MSEPLTRGTSPAAAPDSLKSLLAHLETLQGEVYVVESLVSVIVACGGKANRADLVIKAAEAAQEILLEVGRGLDSVELGKVLS
jgi:hypothetical protein